MKVLKVLGGLVLALVVAGSFAWLLRSDPIGPVAGRGLSGSEAPYPADWGFTDAHTTIFLESRPEAPHSVTTICFVHEGELYVPAQGGSGKRWTGYVEDDPRVRIKVGDTVYPALALRVPDPDPDTFVASAAKKYEQMADPDREVPEDIWLFHIAPREP